MQRTATYLFIGLQIAAYALYWIRLRTGKERRHPPDVYGLLASGLVVALAQALIDPSRKHVGVALGSLVAAGGFLYYMLVYSRYGERSLRVAAGDRLPRLLCVDSDSQTFDSDALMGKAAALYVFYRGFW